MPPIPILALLCLVGLFAYGVIGGAVGVLAMRVLDPHLSHSSYGASVRGLAEGKGGNEGARIGWGFMAILWPAVVAVVVAVVVAGAAVVTVGAGPVWCCCKVGRYLANAQVKAVDSAS